MMQILHIAEDGLTEKLVEHKLTKALKRVYKKNKIKKTVKVKATYKGKYNCGNGMGEHHHYLIEISTS